MVAWTIVAALSPIAVPAHAADPDSWTTWLAAQVALSYPTGDFHPPDPTDGVGLAVHVSLSPPHSPVGIRLDAGSETRRSRTDSVIVAFLYGTQFASVEADNRTLWASIGAQWDLRPRDSSGYLYATVGGVYVQPTGDASGAFLVTANLPGMPGSSTTFGLSVGLGGRVVLGKSKRLAFSSEVEYRRTGAVDYVGAPGVEGSYPNAHYAARHGSIEMVMVRVGIAAPWRRL